MDLSIRQYPQQNTLVSDFVAKANETFGSEHVRTQFAALAGNHQLFPSAYPWARYTIEQHQNDVAPAQDLQPIWNRLLETHPLLGPAARDVEQNPPGGPAFQDGVVARRPAAALAPARQRSITRQDFNRATRQAKTAYCCNKLLGAIGIAAAVGLMVGAMIISPFSLANPMYKNASFLKHNLLYWGTFALMGLAAGAMILGTKACERAESAIQRRDQ